VGKSPVDTGMHILVRKDHKRCYCHQTIKSLYSDLEVIHEKGESVMSYNEMHEAVALLKILAISSENIKAGKIKKADKAFSDIERKLSDKWPTRS
jgi:hypothetical protein